MKNTASAIATVECTTTKSIRTVHVHIARSMIPTRNHVTAQVVLIIIHQLELMDLVLVSAPENALKVTHLIHIHVNANQTQHHPVNLVAVTVIQFTHCIPSGVIN